MPKVSKLENLQQDYTIRKFGRKPDPGQFVAQLSKSDVKIFRAPAIAEVR